MSEAIDLVIEKRSTVPVIPNRSETAASFITTKRPNRKWRKSCANKYQRSAPAYCTCNMIESLQFTKLEQDNGKGAGWLRQLIDYIEFDGSGM